MAVHLLGIRHHGPGSAKNVAAFLKDLKPDIILVEGPPEAEPLLSYIIHQDMKPPVALLAYMPEEPANAVFYPFAHFSAEWQALYYGIYNNIPTRFFDLPLVHSFALNRAKKTEEKSMPDNAENETERLSNYGIYSKYLNAGNEGTDAATAPVIEAEIKGDPFKYLAQAAGLNDGELWWEINFESRNNNAGIFEAVQESVTALRETLVAKDNKHEQLREAWMRKMIRTAEKEGYERIAVICGAWHVPALATMPKQKEDSDLLKGLEKVKVEVTWVPWTYNRLTYRSGYGAGILSPGWYDHLWDFPNDDGTRWMSKIASFLRRKNMDTSVAHVIEAVRLANSLAALRNFNRAGLTELNEATTTVLGFGDDILLRLIHEELIVSDKMGSVPEDVPKVPLLLDIERQQKKFRLQPTAAIKELKLDLREDNDLAKSTFLHRLKLLGINWGEIVVNRSKGTFKEQWQLLWQPEYSILIIERGIWGNTLDEAATKYLAHLAAETETASQLVGLLEKSIPTDLPDSVAAMMMRLDSLAASTTDITELMRSVPGLCNVVRYGNVRKTDLSSMKNMLDSIVARICVGVPLACINIDIESAQQMLDLLMKTDYAIAILKDENISGLWQEALYKIQALHQCNPLIAGYATRLLKDRKAMEYAEVEKQLSFYMSATNAPAEAAFWFEGFLKSSGTILLLDENLWELINNWVAGISNENFIELLPVLRRTFAEFTSAERRKLGEKAKGAYSTSGPTLKVTEDFDYVRAENILPVMSRLLRLKKREP